MIGEVIFVGDEGDLALPSKLAKGRAELRGRMGSADDEDGVGHEGEMVDGGGGGKGEGRVGSRYFQHIRDER